MKYSVSYNFFFCFRLEKMSHLFLNFLLVFLQQLQILNLIKFIRFMNLYVYKTFLLKIYMN